MRKLLIGVVALLVLLVAADRVAVAVAENQVSSKIATAYALPARPGVTIGGFPFLTQAIAGDYREIDVHIPAITADGYQLTGLRVRLTGVHAPLSQVMSGGAAAVTADRATGSALVAYGEVQRSLPAGVKLSPAGDHLRVSGDISYQGLRVPVSADVSLGVTPSGIRVTPSAIQIANGLSVPSSVVASGLSYVIPLQTLPLHLSLTSVRVTAAGLRLTASARNVYFARA